MRPVLKYPGAKYRLSDWICGYIPQHDVYLEPFFGGGGVFFNKQKARIETINDLDGNVINYFKVIRDKCEELVEKLSMTPYGRDEYKDAFKENECDSDVERARKFAVRCFQGFGNSNLYQNGFRSSQQSRSPQTTKAWKELPEIIIQASGRLLDAQIENLPAVELIKRYDTPDVFIYLDPPYLADTRKNYLYKHEMTKTEHVELLRMILKHPGKVMISGYESNLYNDMLKGWNKEYRDTQAEQGLIRTEVLWMNYEMGQMTLV